MKKLRFLIFGFCLLASSCSTVSTVAYLGDRLTPTTAVDIFYSAHDVTKPYKVIGHLSCTNAGTDYVKKQMSAYAVKIGADAIVITGTEGNEGALAVADALKYN